MGTKTEIKITVNGNMNMAENVIRQWLAVNEFLQKEQQGANYFACNDPIKGKKGFEYYINENQITILAYIGTFKKPQALEGFVGMVVKKGYLDNLKILENELVKLDTGEYIPLGSAPRTTAQTDGYAVSNEAQTLDTSFQNLAEKNEKQKETLVIVGFVLSIVGLLISFLGFVFGALIIVFEFGCGIQGLKTKKSGLAIATIVLASIGAFIFVANLVLTAILL